MLTQEQIKEIREHLENAKNPIFLFDNDPDGLCSFLLLRRWLGRGYWSVIKTPGVVTRNAFNKVEEFSSDSIFILDKPRIEQEFLDLAKEKGIPVIQIDHHPLEDPKAEIYFNPLTISKTSEPVSDLCYRVANRKEDLWIACIGAVSDCNLPDFIDELKKKNPELLDYNYKTAFDILYNTQLGKLSMILSFGMRDTTSRVSLMIKYLLNCSDVHDLLEENSKNKSFLSKASKLEEKYKRLFEKAEKEIEEKILFFSYSGEMGLNRDLSNELMYKHPEKVIVVAFSFGNRCNISLRWQEGDIRAPTLEAIKTIEGATGGGHVHAPGVQMKADQFPMFKENLIKELGI
jgi:single-stranded DNA-specific DHH superfamily exonuclease